MNENMLYKRMNSDREYRFGNLRRGTENLRRGGFDYFFHFRKSFQKKVLTTAAICDIIIHVVGTILPKNEAIMPNCVMVAPMTLTHVV